MRASHSKKFSSFTGPAIIPSGGFKVNSEEKLSKNEKKNHTYTLINLEDQPFFNLIKIVLYFRTFILHVPKELILISLLLLHEIDL
jgi:hypothetical protein